MARTATRNQKEDHVFRISKRTIAAAAAIAAASAPSAAYARFELEPVGSTGAVPTTAPSAPSQGASASSLQPPGDSTDGFQWDDAGIGAAAMLGVLGATCATSVMVRRRRHFATRR